MLFILMLVAYNCTLLGVESVSIANYLTSASMIGIVSYFFSFITATIIAIRRCESQFLWFLFGSYLVPLVSPSKLSDFLKTAIPKLIMYEAFFITLFMISSKIL